MPDDRKYSRVYHDAPSDQRFENVWTSDPCLALWLRLLVVADGTWPAPAPVPRSAKPKPLAQLVAAGLVELVPGDLYRIHGMNAERSRRSKQAAHAADVRWHGDSTTASNAPGNAHSNAQPMPSRDETSRNKTSNTRASAEFTSSRPRPNTVDRDPLYREMRDAIVERNGLGMDEPVKT